MKNALNLIILLTLITNAKAQTAHTLSADLLEESRFSFNKKLIKREQYNLQQLPCSQYLFRQSDKCEVNIESLIFVMDNNTITGIKGIDLSAESLKQINDRLGILDRLQWAYSEASNNEFRSGHKNNHDIVFNDRKFFSTLRAIKSTVRDIRKIYGSALSSAEKSEAIAKLRFANVDWQFYRRITEVENKQILASD